MSYLNFKSEYDRFPKTKIKNHKAFCGYEEIYHELKSKMNNNSVVVFDYYPGVDEKEVYVNWFKSQGQISDSSC